MKSDNIAEKFPLETSGFSAGPPSSAMLLSTGFDTQ
jgi:hypothetical protein